MSQQTTVTDFSREAVESFVQTVVFVDDKIYGSYGGAIREPKKLAGAVKIRKTASKKAVKKAATKEARQEVQIEEPQFSPHDIQASFAKKRIVCSLHQPLRQNSVGTASDTYKLCASADIIIVDWDLYGDAGEKARELVKNLVVQSLEDDPHQLRLVLIYTDNPNLFDVADSLFRVLNDNVKSEIDYPEADQGLAFHTLNARVVVLGKPANRTLDLDDFVVEETALADRAVSEFCKLADGLLQGCILKGLAEIRKQSRKILTKFHSGLDAAFLTHRALGLPHEEAFEHVTPLLVSEIEAVLEDGLAKPLVESEVIENWCEAVWVPAEHAENILPDDVGLCEFSKSLCEKGLELPTEHRAKLSRKSRDALNKNPPRWPSSDSADFKSLTTFHSVDDSGDDSRELGMLMSLRTQYGDNHRLTLGTIIRELSGDKRYLICLQPPCDSVRLRGNTVFMFCLLGESTGQKIANVVQHDGAFVDLTYKPKIENGVALIFNARSSKGVVHADNLVFTDSKDNEYAWVAQLKSHHAQRAVEEFARNLSRVGLIESEWLRLKAM
ncbi:MAG: response regulator receiver domain [Candidatus Thiodiazotropha sp.]